MATGEAVYKKVRTFVPKPLDAYVVTLEDKAAALSAPYVSLATDKAAYALSFADSKVRGLPAMHVAHVVAAAHGPGS